MTEMITVAVPYPTTKGEMGWGIVCPDHPTYMDSNVPTDYERCCAEAFAEACACAHPDHQEKATIHVTSATQIVTPDGQHVLAMCGDDLGPYDAASKIHPVGNYLWSGSPHWERVTCQGCLTRCGRN